MAKQEYIDAFETAFRGVGAALRHEERDGAVNVFAASGTGAEFGTSRKLEEASAELGTIDGRHLLSKVCRAQNEAFREQIRTQGDRVTELEAQLGAERQVSAALRAERDELAAEAKELRKVVLERAQKASE